MCDVVIILYLSTQDPVSVVTMPEESPYVNLGDVQPVNLLQFSHQIAAGMVSVTKAHR